jgi:hypothetical protein
VRRPAAGVLQIVIAWRRSEQNVARLRTELSIAESQRDASLNALRSTTDAVIKDALEDLARNPGGGES